MRLIKGSLAGLVLAGILAMMPAAAFAHGGGGGGGHGFGGFTGRGFSPGFSGTRGFSTGRFSGRGDHGRFGDRGFRDHRVFFQQFAWPVYYPYDYSYLDYEPDNDYQYGDNSAASVQPESLVPPAVPQPTQTAAKGTQTTPQAHAGAFGNLVLISWLEDAGKDVIYVQNTETNDVQKITSEPNLDNFRIVELHPNADPRLFEAVISNGSQQGPVRFRF